MTENEKISDGKQLRHQATIGSSKFLPTCADSSDNKENPLLKAKTFEEDSATNKMMSATLNSTLASSQVHHYHDMSCIGIQHIEESFKKSPF